MCTMTGGNIIELAIKDADLIESDLKRKYLGAQIAKRAIRTFYKLPASRAVNMWEILAQRGFIVTNRDVFVPKEEPAPSPDQKKD